MATALLLTLLVGLQDLPKEPRPRPSGTLVVHARDGSGPFRLWKLELKDGDLSAPPRPLTDGPGWSWSPLRQAFGEWVVYFATNEEGEVLRRQLKPGTDEPLPHFPDPDGDRDVVVSPDGTWIAYSESRDENEDLYLRSVSPEGDLGQERVLVSGPGNEMTPRWSPDGKRLLFRSDRDGVGMELYSVVVSSGAVVQLTEDDAFVNDLSWSPDGEHVLYRSDRGGSQDLYVMPAGGGESRRITRDPGFDGEGCWSPDGAWIAFMSDRSGNAEIYIVRPDGSGLTRITETEERAEGVPAWLP